MLRQGSKPTNDDQLLELVTQSELHHTRVSEQSCVIAEGGRNVQFRCNGLHVEVSRVSHVENLPAELEALLVRPWHLPPLGHTHVNPHEAIAADLVASAGIAGERRGEGCNGA